MIDLYYWTTPNGHKITITIDAYAKANEINTKPSVTDAESRRILFGQK